MKKLKLKALELGANEVLTRAQLKNVFGGADLATTHPPCKANACSGTYNGAPAVVSCQAKEIGGVWDGCGCPTGFKGSC